MFSANRLPAKCVFLPKNGPVPSQPVNGYAGEIPNAADRWLVEVSLIDRQFLLAIDGRTVVRQPYEHKDSPPTPVSTPLAIGIQGLGASVDRLRVYRDVYYTRPIGLASRGVVRLGMGEYYVLGDNSPASADSRHWPDGGAVEANLLVGKPLAAISSVQFAPLPVWRFSVPNPAGIRYIR